MIYIAQQTTQKSYHIHKKICSNITLKNGNRNFNHQCVLIMFLFTKTFFIYHMLK